MEAHPAARARARLPPGARRPAGELGFRRGSGGGAPHSPAPAPGCREDTSSAPPNLRCPHSTAQPGSNCACGTSAASGQAPAPPLPCSGLRPFGVDTPHPLPRFGSERLQRRPFLLAAPSCPCSCPEPPPPLVDPPCSPSPRSPGVELLPLLQPPLLPGDPLAQTPAPPRAQLYLGAGTPRVTAPLAGPRPPRGGARRLRSRQPAESGTAPCAAPGPARPRRSARRRWRGAPSRPAAGPRGGQSSGRAAPAQGWVHLERALGGTRGADPALRTAPGPRAHTPSQTRARSHTHIAAAPEAETPARPPNHTPKQPCGKGAEPGAVPLGSARESEGRHWSLETLGPSPGEPLSGVRVPVASCVLDLGRPAQLW